MSESKKVIILALLLSVGLYFTYPGNEYTITNRLLAATKILHSATINFDDLSPSLSDSDITSKYSELDLDCGIEASTLGGQSCYNHVNSLNSANAWHIAFFFRKNRLRQVKMDFLESGHNEILAMIKSQYGKPSNVKNSKQQIPLIMWTLKEGILVTNSSSYPGRTTQVLWVSKAEIISKLLKGKGDRNLLLTYSTALQKLP